MQTLLADPTSWLQAASAEWEYPVSREWMIAADAYDLEMQVRSKRGHRPKPFPRPWPDKKAKLGGKSRNKPRTVAETMAILRPPLPELPVGQVTGA